MSVDETVLNTPQEAIQKWKPIEFSFLDGDWGCQDGCSECQYIEITGSLWADFIYDPSHENTSEELPNTKKNHGI